MRKLIFTGERMIPELNFGATFYYEHINRYKFASNFVKGKKVLDLACGSGYGSQTLSLGGARKVVGLDISKEAIAYARRKYKGKNVEFRVGNALKTGLKQASFDVVVCFEFIEHVTQQDILLAEIKRLLKPGGVLVISTPNRTTYTDDNRFHKKELNLKEFNSLLSRYFANVSILGQFFWFSNFIVKVNSDSIADSTFPPVEVSRSQYFVGVASDKRIEKISQSLVASDNVDKMDLSGGTQPLGKFFAEQGGEVNELKRVLEEITSSKTYKVWQLYCQIRDKLLGKK